VSIAVGPGAGEGDHHAIVGETSEDTSTTTQLKQSAELSSPGCEQPVQHSVLVATNKYKEVKSSGWKTRAEESLNYPIPAKQPGRPLRLSQDGRPRMPIFGVINLETSEGGDPGYTYPPNPTKLLDRVMRLAMNAEYVCWAATHTGWSVNGAISGFEKDEPITLTVELTV
jgi:hypothetical protein